ncbi:LOW QUALITY PROTEIN: tyrosine-protein phosphatase non-receptor type 22 [Dromiciops gliroides]|uniref:LOW QUALITY PROTEIN: tyrosine-protein phosphatase non-receptor type 22 n=1 Tax=Dromiciops gliroides TaxID=33562 RepID=UPI001CC65B1F|nr:LOW QUALITY PROTEIN: tyrosine-protein phosphatase non-receptor type 22 [Dromiciops gliroides]
MDQKEILQRYLDEAKNKKLVREEFASEFLKLKRQSTKYKMDKTYPTTVAEKPENIKKNRYKDILPFDHSRVKLSLITSDEDSHYINANFIKGVYGPKAYIATQGPLATTLLDFWRMIWEYSVLIIVMACMEFEMGKKKCERYWAEPGETVLQCGPFSISCESENKKSDYVIRTLKAKLNNETRTIYQFHYKNWPDHDVPSSIDPILELIWEMRCYQEDDSVPICIHCSAGCGRTGVLCAVDYTWKLLKDGIIPVNFSIFSLIQDMRTQRPSLVQTQEQYELVYNAVLELFKRQVEVLTDNQDAAGPQIQGNHAILKPHSALEGDPYSHMAPDCPDEDDSVKCQQNKHVTQEGTVKASSLDCGTPEPHGSQGFSAHSVKQDASVEVLELNCSSEQNADRCMKWETKLHSLLGEPLQKHGSLDLNSILAGTCSNSGHANGRQPNVKVPLTRTKSTPFELPPPRQTKECEINAAFPCLEAQQGHSYSSIDLQAQRLKTISSVELNHLLSDPKPQMHAASHPKVYVSSAYKVHPYTSLAEDPYFSQLPPSNADPPMCVDFLEKPGGTVFSFSSSSTATTTPICDGGSFNSLASNPSTNHFHPPLSRRTSVDSAELDDEIPPPLPERTPESFIVAEESGNFSEMTSKAHSSPAKLKIGTSLEWSGVTESEKSDDSIRLRPSKSVKLRSSKSDEDRSSSPPPPLPERTPESFLLADEDSMQIQSVETRSTNCLENLEDITSSQQSLKTSGKGFTRSRSLKILRNVKKSISSQPVKPAESVQSNHSSSFLNFGKAFRVYFIPICVIFTHFYHYLQRLCKPFFKTKRTKKSACIMEHLI